MRITCVIEAEYENAETAKKILQSVKIDDYDFVESKQEKNVIVAKIESPSIPSLLHTIDDYLACLSVAEHVVANKH
ncbi:MAG TPA: hypothetical protein ENI42_05660 [Thermoplasmatales archaeon]|nr:hypothetical protein [Thermoplasmatales archaeon]